MGLNGLGKPLRIVAALEEADRSPASVFIGDREDGFCQLGEIFGFQLQ